MSHSRQRIVVVNTQVPFIRGGAEILADNLVLALREFGHVVEHVNIPFKWYPPETIAKHMLACRLLDLTETNGMKIDLMIGLKFPAYLVPHPNRRLWLCHQHRQAYDWWQTDKSDLSAAPGGAAIRNMIMAADRRHIGECRAIYTISQNVSRRLKNFCGVDSQALYHPPNGAEKFACEAYEKFVFFPSRINDVKRQRLLIEAMALVEDKRLKAVFAGVPDRPEYLNEIHRLVKGLGLERQVEFRGGVSELEKRELYSKCLCVVYPPFDEDYGYVTLEAMLSAKAVVTTTDAGGALEFVSHGEQGFVVEPTPQGLADALNEISSSQGLAERLGSQALARYRELDMCWENVVRKLTE
jgi:glycosyltransferase involved in cell wall biosynthesis